jgi:hypothetical protein
MVTLNNRFTMTQTEFVFIRVYSRLKILQGDRVPSLRSGLEQSYLIIPIRVPTFFNIPSALVSCS